MNGLVFEGIDKVAYSVAPDPEIVLATDAIVKVNLCAICGSDLHVYHGQEKGLDHGTVMGHEFMGEVVAIGKDIRSLKKGERVMSPFSTSCGRCFYCKKGLTSRCVQSALFGWVENGIGLAGAQAEYVRVPNAESTLVKIPAGIHDEEALLLGDIIPTGYYCAHQAEVNAEEVCVVIGCGPVGIMTIIGALVHGAEIIYAIDTVKERLSFAETLGAIPLNPNHVDAKGMIKDATSGRGADSVMEAVGKSETVRLSYDLVRPGGVISMVGVCTDNHIPFSPVEAYNKNITFKVGRCPARFLMDDLCKIVLSRKYDFSAVISHRFNLSEGPYGYDIFANKKDNCSKVVLRA